MLAATQTPMVLVTLAQDLRPWRKGDRVPMPEAQARQLVESGEAVNPEPFGEHAQPARSRLIAPPRRRVQRPKHKRG